MIIPAVRLQWGPQVYFWRRKCMNTELCTSIAPPLVIVACVYRKRCICQHVSFLFSRGQFVQHKGLPPLLHRRGQDGRQVSGVAQYTTPFLSDITFSVSLSTQLCGIAFCNANVKTSRQELLKELHLETFICARLLSSSSNNFLKNLICLYKTILWNHTS